MVTLNGTQVTAREPGRPAAAPPWAPRHARSVLRQHVRCTMLLYVNCSHRWSFPCDCLKNTHSAIQHVDEHAVVDGQWSPAQSADGS